MNKTKEKIAQSILMICVFMPMFYTQISEARISDKSEYEEMTVTAPRSKRDLYRARVELSDQLIEKLNQNATGNDIITCKIQKVLLGFKSGITSLRRVCATKRTHRAREKLIKTGKMKCGAAYGEPRSGDFIFSCNPSKVKYTSKKISKDQSKNINTRVIDLVRTDPEFAELVKEAKKLQYEYENYGKSK